MNDAPPIEQRSEIRDQSSLLATSREDLIALVAELRSLIEDQATVIAEIVDERNAARLLNELCHY